MLRKPIAATRSFLFSSLRPDAFSAPGVEDVRFGLFEFLGTILFLLFGLLGCQSGASAALLENGVINALGTLDYCASSMSATLFVVITIFFRVTGGIFNPAIALALFLVGAFRFWRFVFVVVAQLAGAIVASALLKGLYPGHLSIRTEIAPGVGIARAIFLEAFATGLLVITVLMVATDKRNSSSKIFAPLSIAAALYVGHVTTLPYTGTSMNPARSFGPAVVDGDFTGTHWVFWIGPIIGSLVATVFYKYLQYTEYWRLGNCEEHVEGLLPLFHKDQLPPPAPCDLERGLRQVASTSTPSDQTSRTCSNDEGNYPGLVRRESHTSSDDA